MNCRIQYYACLSVTLGIVTLSDPASAACLNQISGPVGRGSEYYYASTCFATDPARTIIRNQVCSVAKATLVFSWSKLNWVSGSAGVPYGDCLVQTAYATNAVDTNGSEIKTNVTSPLVTDVYLPNLNDNSGYWKTVDGGSQQVDEGARVPFHFEISFDPTLVGGQVLIRVRMNGENPVFYLILPRAIKNKDDLEQYLNNQDLERISPLVTFGGEPLKSKFTSKDNVLGEYYSENGVAERGVVTVHGEKQLASLDFSAQGDLVSIVSGVLICVGQGEAIATCFGNANE
jgi:hypothetical protein